jgi:16S rRNA C967 or C1407 C5-methylase (RsmB/RsmF family)
MHKNFRENHLFSFLLRFDAEGKPLDLSLADFFKSKKSLGSHDRRFLGDSAYGLVRWKGLLDHMLGKPSSWEERFFLYQRFDFNKIPTDIPEWIRCGASKWLYDEVLRSHGKEKAASLCRALNEQAPLTVRFNPLKTTREALLASWKGRYGAQACETPTAIRFPKREPLTSLPEFKEGLFEIQDEGSQIVAQLVLANPGDQVLDYCSGSGGKSLAFADRLKGKGQIYLHDIREHILHQAKKRMKRAGIQNAQFLQPGHRRLSSLKNKIDWVLADVPCSGSGTYRRNPDMKWKADEAMLDDLVQRQREIFKLAIDYAKPGGKIVYATCSLFSRENQEQVDYFLKTLPLELEGKPLSILPTFNGPDGFFAAVFSKKILCSDKMSTQTM